MDNISQQKQPYRKPSPFYVALMKHIKNRYTVAAGARSTSGKKIMSELDEMAHVMNDLFRLGVDGSFKDQEPGAGK